MTDIEQFIGMFSFRKYNQALLYESFFRSSANSGLYEAYIYLILHQMYSIFVLHYI